MRNLFHVSKSLLYLKLLIELVAQKINAVSNYWQQSLGSKAKVPNISNLPSHLLAAVALHYSLLFAIMNRLSSLLLDTSKCA